MKSLLSQSWGYSVQAVLNEETGEYEYAVEIQWMDHTHCRDGFKTMNDAFDYVDFIQDAGLDYVKSLN
jgi:hypothetical protein